MNTLLNTSSKSFLLFLLLLLRLNKAFKVDGQS